ncbi:MAG: hypothetical protein ACYCUF_13095 [Acidimicrobiales bacterium]|nr:hypothetical protein [Actinomycetota bacterium]
MASWQVANFRVLGWHNGWHNGSRVGRAVTVYDEELRSAASTAGIDGLSPR